MRLLYREFSASKQIFHPKSRIKIYRQLNPDLKTCTSKLEPTASVSNFKPQIPVRCAEADVGAGHDEFTENVVKVQMISNNLHKQIFKDKPRQHINDEEMKMRISQLEKHGIDVKSSDFIKDANLNLPPLRGKNIEEHFFAIANEQIEPYEKLLMLLVECSELPLRPTNWSFTNGWTIYDNKTGEGKAIEVPLDNALVLDVEVCVSDGLIPTIATAVSSHNWYSWVSPRLTNNQTNSGQNYSLKDLIPLGMEGPKMVVGHNVSYDRARLREQYLLNDTGVRFVDTMSLHTCVSGITSYQRALLKSHKEPSLEDLNWQSKSSLNSLVEVHRLYCGGEPLSKEPRDIFVNGSLLDVKNNFQSLMTYCAGDVTATHNILKTLYPLYKERFPHPATLAGILELGSAYLPVNSNWLRYLNESNLTYEDLDIEAKNHLSRRADDACRLLQGEKYRENLWLWDEDWSTQELKLKQKKNAKKDKGGACNENEYKRNANMSREHELEKKFQYLYDMKTLLPVRRPLLPGYPAWYRKLCKKFPRTEDAKLNELSDWTPGATEIGTGMQIAPKLLSLCWEGYPLHYIREHGWGFLVPFKPEHASIDSNYLTSTYRIPIKQLAANCSVLNLTNFVSTKQESEYAFDALDGELNAKLCKKQYYSKPQKDHTKGVYEGSGVWCKQILEDCCYFLKLPHKNGKSFRVGNPLSKDFLNKFSDNVLSSGDAVEGSAKRVIDIARMMSYWRNNRDRIMGQMVVWNSTKDLPDHLKNSKTAVDFGAICPQVVTCGTLTRRAMEPTWMTASNSQRERIGSELRAMIQAPPTYRIVGADVDSQELWIASVLGDAYESVIHGATPLGWMTLSGSKSKGTDMHSMTAKAVGISRDHAKVINYARIYGAGQNFAEGLLKQFNPTFSDTEAKKKAMTMFTITKGKRVYKLQKKFLGNFEDKSYSSYEALRLAASCNCSVNEMFQRPCWVGGTESAMFNRLEEIASGEQPKTPFLGCRLSRALEANEQNDNRFITTRINWIVQSGAVDFLHLMLVCMRWLMGPHLRFCLSFHDEVRYLVKEEVAYKTALSLHLTNLLTRSFCASRLGLYDLPMSVAFFSSVEVDTVLRKESTMDCKTPSNPHGLHIGYGIPPGENLSIYDAIDKAGGGDFNQWPWLKKHMYTPPDK